MLNCKRKDCGHDRFSPDPTNGHFNGRGPCKKKGCPCLAFQLRATKAPKAPRRRPVAA
jgi:hypothetical protein